MPISHTAGDSRIITLNHHIRLPLEKVIHSSILAWRIPWTEELEGLVHRVTRSRIQLKQLSMYTHRNLKFHTKQRRERRHPYD